MKKIKVLMDSDFMLLPSGVGTQTRYVAEALLKSDKFSVVQLGGAVRHESYDPLQLEEWGSDLKIWPVNGYGDPDMVRSVIRTERPDIMWIMTDPRFWGWLFQMEDEIRPLVPLVYYNVWDNWPAPHFNRPWYVSCDKLVAISKLTRDINKVVAPEVDVEYLPHAVNDDIFKTYTATDIDKFRRESFALSKGFDPDEFKGKTLYFWNNRNARRKEPGSLVWWFNDFLDIVGRDQATLVLHTEPQDEHGCNLEHIVDHLQMGNGQVLFSRDKLPPQILAKMYNMVDCTINISNAEGFGLSTLESLSCGTPIIVNMTGGLQEQVTDGKDFFGFGIEPSSKTVIGSQRDALYIYEDTIKREDFLDTMVKFHKLSKKEQRALGKKGQQHVLKNYNFKAYEQRWVDLMLEVYEKYGSWDTRKGYKTWEMKEV